LFTDIMEKINKKILVVVLFVVLVGIIAFFIVRNVLQMAQIAKTGVVTPSKTFYSTDKELNITLDKSFNFKQYNSINDYILELRNPDNYGIFISKKDIILDKEFEEVVSTDQRVYVKKFEMTSNVSNVRSFNTKLSNNAYTYSFQYLEKQSRVPYHIQVTWIEKENFYYVIDIELPYSMFIENSDFVLNALNSISY